MSGRGHFWPAAYKLPSPEDRRLRNVHQHWPACWGMKMKTLQNLLFVINASDPMSMVNDYHNISTEPNAEFVQKFFKGVDGSMKPTLEVSVQMLKDIEPGDQVLVDYGQYFNWSEVDDAMEGTDDDKEKVGHCTHTYTHTHMFRRFSVLTLSFGCTASWHLPHLAGDVRKHPRELAGGGG